MEVEIFARAWLAKLAKISARRHTNLIELIIRNIGAESFNGKDPYVLDVLV